MDSLTRATIVVALSCIPLIYFGWVTLGWQGALIGYVIGQATAVIYDKWYDGKYRELTPEAKDE